MSGERTNASQYRGVPYVDFIAEKKGKICLVECGGLSGERLEAIKILLGKDSRYRLIWYRLIWIPYLTSLKPNLWKVELNGEKIKT
jgi:hypothetical protein